MKRHYTTRETVAFNLKADMKDKMIPFAEFYRFLGITNAGLRYMVGSLESPKDAPKNLIKLYNQFLEELNQTKKRKKCPKA